MVRTTSGLQRKLHVLVWLGLLGACGSAVPLRGEAEVAPTPEPPVSRGVVASVPAPDPVETAVAGAATTCEDPLEMPELALPIQACFARFADEWGSEVVAVRTANEIRLAIGDAMGRTAQVAFSYHRGRHVRTHIEMRAAQSDAPVVQVSMDTSWLAPAARLSTRIQVERDESRPVELDFEHNNPVPGNSWATVVALLRSERACARQVAAFASRHVQSIRRVRCWFISSHDDTCAYHAEEHRWLLERARAVASQLRADREAICGAIFSLRSAMRCLPPALRDEVAR